MSRRGAIVTFTNLFPSAAMPRHGLFVKERMQRVAAATGAAWQVVCPVPQVPALLRRRAIDRAFAAMPAQEQVDGVPVHHPRYRHIPGFSMRRQADRMVAGARALLAKLCAERPVVLDAHYVYPDGVAALRLGAELGVPVFVTARGSDVNVLGKDPRIAAQIRAVAAGARRLFAVGEPLRRGFAELAGLPDGRVALVRNGVDLARFRPGDQALARERLGLPSAGALVVGVGRLVRGKGFHVMAQALRKLPAAVHFAVAGDGPEREVLVNLAPPGRLHLLGARSPDEVATLLQAADLLVLPSESEGWPNVVTEALASGVPVVATPVGAVPELLASPVAGALVRVGDAEALAREVARVLGMPRDAERIAAWGRRFSWDEPIAALSAAFEEAFAA
ncbi:MAG: glycosyltransferase [Planctomycetes bacterium]|nr:glycosyltransferase [Planctomycetota bacterium]